jgi:hypothetical protein
VATRSRTWAREILYQGLGFQSSSPPPLLSLDEYAEVSVGYVQPNLDSYTTPIYMWFMASNYSRQSPYCVPLELFNLCLYTLPFIQIRHTMFCVFYSWTFPLWNERNNTIGSQPEHSTSCEKKLYLWSGPPNLQFLSLNWQLGDFQCQPEALHWGSVYVNSDKSYPLVVWVQSKYYLQGGLGFFGKKCTRAGRAPADAQRRATGVGAVNPNQEFSALAWIKQTWICSNSGAEWSSNSVW